MQENLEVSGSIYSNTVLKKKIDVVFENLFKLSKLKKRIPFSLSGGERQLLAFAMGLIHKPKLILFDEPIAGLDSKNKDTILKSILKLNKELKITFLIVEHLKGFPDTFFNRHIHITLGKIN